MRRAALQRQLDALTSAARDQAAPPLFGARADLLVPVLEAAGHLGAFLGRHPSAAAELAALPPVRDAAAWREELEKTLGAAALTTGDDQAFGRALRIARQRAMLGAAGRELASGDPLATGADLAGFASAALDVALARAEAIAQSRYGLPMRADGTVSSGAVIGMGKLGGNELNYSSDIDILFVYDGEVGQTDGARGLGQVIDLHTYWARVFARVVEILGEVTDEGFVFRVDLDLRPEGRTGPICNSVDALESYYETFGHAWERLAWIRARPVAGDLALGARVIADLRPFVFRKHLDYGFADEVLAMKRRIDQSGARLGHKDGFNVKLGRGGIREVEFAVQTLQLTWGGRLPELRATDTKTALHRVALAGLMDQNEADHLLAAYRFLRRIEHILQMQEDRQTHLLPIEGEGRRHVAAMLRLDEAQFEHALADHKKRVRAAFEAVVAGSAPTGPDPRWEEAFAAALEPELGPEQREAAIGELGFARPVEARHRFDALARRPESPFHPRAVARGEDGQGLAKKVVRAAVASPDPDQALLHFEGLFRVLRDRKAALEQLEQDPRRLRVLATLFGSSQTLSRLVVRSPGLLDRLVLDGKEPPLRSRTQLQSALQAELNEVGGGVAPADLDGRLAAVRRFKQAETARIGFFDLAGVLDGPTIVQQLSDLADAVLQALAMGDGLGVVALGDLGARALGYGTPLDLLFVAGEEELPRATRAARQIVTGLTSAGPEGALYMIDTATRPSGHQGPACVSPKRLRERHRGGEAALWEQVALLGARVVVDQVVDGADGIVKGLVEEVRAALFGSARASIGETARALPAEASSDAVVRFVRVQQLCAEPEIAAKMRAGHAAGAVSVTAALHGFGELGVIEAARAARMVEAWAWLRQLDNRLALVQEHVAESRRLLALDAATWSPGETEHLRRLALRMGHGDPAGGDPAAALSKEVARHRATLAQETRELRS